MKNFILWIWIGVYLGSIVKVNAQSCCGNPSVYANSENVLNFTTLQKKRFIADLNLDYTHIKSTEHSNHSSNTHDHHNHNHSSNTNAHTSLQSILLNTAQVRYGLHDKITLHAQIPFWLVESPNEYASIFGDASLLATYKVMQKENYGIGATTGIELPTGNSYLVFENNYLITGSGSFDPIVGAFTWFKYKKFITRLQTQYKQGMKGFDNIHFGSTVNTQWIVAYYLKGIESESKFKINFNTGLSQDWTNAHTQNGKFIDNTGSFILWYNAGTQIQYKKILFPLSFIVPVYMNLRGMQNEPQFRLKTGVTLMF